MANPEKNPGIPYDRPEPTYLKYSKNQLKVFGIPNGQVASHVNVFLVGATFSQPIHRQTPQQIEISSRLLDSYHPN